MTKRQKVTLRAVLYIEVDETWASNQTNNELVEYIRSRMNSSLGFRGEILKSTVKVLTVK